MSGDELPPVDSCDVEDKASLLKYRQCNEKWRRWLRTDPHHPLWAQIYSMLIADLTYRSIAAAANADPQGALHCPILRRAITEGYAAGQGVAIRRLVDRTKGTMSLFKLLEDIRNNLAVMTRENIVCSGGAKYDDAWLAQQRFDRLAGISSENRKRSDRLPKRLIARIASWLDDPSIEAVETWCNERVTHAPDLTARGITEAVVVEGNTVAAAQRRIVRVAEAIWACLLDGPAHIAVIPVLQYSQFFRFDMLVVNQDALGRAEEQWSGMADERDHWPDGVFEALIAPDDQPADV